MYTKFTNTTLFQLCKWLEIRRIYHKNNHSLG